MKKQLNAYPAAAYRPPPPLLPEREGLSGVKGGIKQFPFCTSCGAETGGLIRRGECHLFPEQRAIYQGASICHHHGVSCNPMGTAEGKALPVWHLRGSTEQAMEWSLGGRDCKVGSSSSIFSHYKITIPKKNNKNLVYIIREIMIMELFYVVFHYSFCHCLLQSTTSYPVHVWSSRYS